MGRFINKYTNECFKCAHGKGGHGRASGLLHPIDKLATPFHTLHIDHLEPFCRSDTSFERDDFLADKGVKHVLNANSPRANGQVVR
ncbi:hypothetical protein WA026_022427 [Henosepilachna vigintioctopunctata]|uniref:Uncharacterized protein n=1 Tax=Henosepilachna vigintioctopunctata TaxID=420089 RepID=A0AAW1UD38_9CUCU